MSNNICPCCGKGCDLSAPRCERGVEYLRTGVIPEKKSRTDGLDAHEGIRQHRHGHQKHHGHHGHHGHYAQMQTPEKLVVMTKKLSKAIHISFDNKSTQNRILHLLSKEDQMTQNKLTEYMDIQPGSASEILKKMEAAGMILRTPNTEDRRMMNIQLTDLGKEQAEKNEVVRQSHLKELFQVLSAQEQELLLSLMEKLSADLENRYRNPRERKNKHHHRTEETTD